MGTVARWILGGAIAVVVAIVIATVLIIRAVDDHPTALAAATVPASTTSTDSSSLASQKTAYSAHSSDDKTFLVLTVRDRTHTKVPATVVLSRSTGDGTMEFMQGRVNRDGSVQLDQNGLDLVAGHYLVVVSKSLGSGYTRDYHAKVTVISGKTTTALVTYRKIKSRTVISCVVRHRRTSNHGATVRYSSPSAPSSSSSTRSPVRVNVSGKSRAQVRIAVTAPSNGGQSITQKIVQTASINQRASGSCGNNCSVSNNNNGNINQNAQQTAVQVGGSGTGSNIAGANVSTSGSGGPGSSSSVCVELSGVKSGNGC